ncbi:hypothetical protein L9F63_025970, partial [Diploptera punctata]
GRKVRIILAIYAFHPYVDVHVLRNMHLTVNADYRLNSVLSTSKIILPQLCGTIYRNFSKVSLSWGKMGWGKTGFKM